MYCIERYVPLRLNVAAPAAARAHKIERGLIFVIPIVYKWAHGRGGGHYMYDYCAPARGRNIHWPERGLTNLMDYTYLKRINVNMIDY